MAGQPDGHLVSAGVGGKLSVAPSVPLVWDAPYWLVGAAGVVLVAALLLKYLPEA